MMARKPAWMRMDSAATLWLAWCPLMTRLMPRAMNTSQSSRKTSSKAWTASFRPNLQSKSNRPANLEWLENLVCSSSC